MDSTRHAGDRGATSIPRGAHEPFCHARALRVCGARDDPRRRRRRASRRDLRVEPLRAGADDPDPPDGTRPVARDGDGRGRGVRRGQRARPGLPPLSTRPRGAARAAVRLAGRCNRDGRARRAREDRRTRGAGRCGERQAQGDARPHSRRPVQSRGHPRRGGSGSRDARVPRERRVPRAVPVRHRPRPGRLASRRLAVTPGRRVRPRRLGREREAVPRSRPRGSSARRGRTS